MGFTLLVSMWLNPKVLEIFILIFFAIIITSLFKFLYIRKRRAIKNVGGQWINRADLNCVLTAEFENEV